MQRKLVESRRSSLPAPEPVPNIADLMDDWFYGSVSKEQKRYDDNLTGGDKLEDYEDGSDSTGKLTQEWLQEAKRIVASSPSRHGSPSRLVGSPRFASDFSSLDRRDPLSRSARRLRSTDGFSGEILSKSAKHTRNKSETFETTVEKSPAAAVHQWFTNILKPNMGQEPKQDHSSMAETLPSRPPITRRKSRFQDDPTSQFSTPPKPIARRVFKTQNSLQENQVLSPPKHLIESARRRSISSSTCSLDKFSKMDVDREGDRDLKSMDDAVPLNLFLEEQRAKMERISRGEISAKAKIILSGTTNSTSSMMAALSYAWLLENKKEDEEELEVVVPVMNMKRGRMWKQKQAAWLLHHAGIDATSLLFSDEVDLEGLLMARQLKVLLVGEDILKLNGEVGSQCTLVTDNYCEEAYDLLQSSSLKKLLLAGILLDTHNLDSASRLSTNRDSEAVQLLLVGSAPNLRQELHHNLMQDQKDSPNFLEVLRSNYGKPPTSRYEENGEWREQKVLARRSTSDALLTMNTTPVMRESGSITEQRQSVRKSFSATDTERKKETSNTTTSSTQVNPKNKVSPKSGKQNDQPAAVEAAKQPKNKLFLAKWFGWGSK